jgi:hypothetical protein
MTLQEFDSTGWTAGMRATYEGEEYWIRNVDFKERLVGLIYGFLDPYNQHDLDLADTQWVRCENITLLNQN